MGKNAITSKSGRVWIQPGGPGYPVYLLACRNSGDLSEPTGSLEVLRRFKDSGEGWEVIGETESPPDPVTFSLETNIFEERDWLEKVKCPYSLYVLERDCGRADIFNNYIRGEILSNARNAQRSYSNLTMREEDSESLLSVDIEAWPPLLDVDKVTVDRMVTTETVDINDVTANLESRCAGDCGAELNPGDQATVVTDATAGAAGHVVLSADIGATWTATAAAPFAVGVANHVMSTARAYIGRTTLRRFAAKLFGAGTQGVVAYSDDAGATWTSANVGGAAAGHGAAMPGALYFDGPYFGFLASALGYIYKTIDAGQTWVAKESGTIAVGNYNAVHFASDKQYGIAVGAADIIALSDDSGETWTVATATGSGATLNCAWRFNKNRMLVGTANGRLYQSTDGGVTWTQITGWAGSGVGQVRDISFANDHIGFMASNTAAPVGTILRTINGGLHWEALTTPTNSGIDAVFAASSRLAYAVGPANGGTGLILKISAA